MEKQNKDSQKIALNSEEINKLVNSIQLDKMNNSVDNVNNQISFISKSVSEIKLAVEDINKQSISINNSANEQALGTKEIMEAMEEVASKNIDTLQTADSLQELATKLNNSAKTLYTEVGAFKI